MVKKMLLPILLCMAVSVPNQCVLAAGEMEIFVDQKASSGGDGSVENPFNTIDDAKKEAQKHKNESVRIVLRGGDYYIKNSVVFDENDSRDEENPLTVTVYDGEKASLIGAKKIDASRFSVVSDSEITERIPVSARGKVYSLNLKEQGDFEYWTFKQFGAYYTTTVSEMPDLYVNGEKMTCARWPNEGYSKVGEVIDPGSSDNPIRVKPAGARGACFKYSDDRISRWKNAPDAMLYGYWMWNWECANLRIKDIDVKNKTITTVDSATFGVAEGQRFMAYNLLEELDSSGEWYIDREKEILYFYPTCDIKDTDMMISQLSEPIIKVENCANVNFCGLNIEYGKADLVTVDNNCKNISLRGCIVRGSSGYGLFISGINNGIINSDIYDCASEGVLIQGGKCDNTEYTLSKNYVINCDIHDCGQRLTTSAGVRDQAHGAIITHNKIYSIPAWGIGWGGFETQVEYNEVFDVLKETEDAGAIYAGRSSQARGSSISHNYIHDVYGQEDLRTGAYIGIYLDDYLCAVKVEGNVFENVATPIYGHHSAQCVIENNIMVNKTAQSNGWILWTRGGGENSNYSFVTSHTSIDWTKEPYKTLFPDAVNMTLDNILQPFDNVIKNNLVVNHQGANITPVVYEMGEIHDNYECSDDPGFVDPENGNYSLKADSKVFEIMPEFKNIDMSKMGIYHEDERPGYSKTEKIKPYTLVSPKDGEENVSTSSVTFMWNVCPELNIDNYRLIIAKDKDFKDVVYNYQVSDLQKEVKGLDANTEYYWRVDAVSKKDGRIYTNDDGVRCFRTSYYKKTKSDETVKYKDLSDWFYDSENWKKGSLDSITATSENVTVKGDLGVVGYEGEYTDYNTLYHFGVEFNGGSWKAFALHSDNTEQLGWVHNAHYLVIVKPDAIELHKYPDSFKNVTTIKTISRNTSFEDKAVHDIVFGTYVKDDVNYIVFAMDGDVIFNIKDIYKEEKKAQGYFAVYNIGGEMTLTKPISELPEISFKERELPAQYEKALDSSVLMKIGEPRAYADEKEEQINAKNPDIVPIVRNNRTLIPVRFASESIGADVSWDENAKSAVITKADKTVKLTAGDNTAYLNGEAKTLDSAPVIENNTMYLPARFLMESLGYSVKYDESTQLILIIKLENEALISNERYWWEILENYVMYARAEKEKFINAAWDNGGKLSDAN